MFLFSKLLKGITCPELLLDWRTLYVLDGAVYLDVLVNELDVLEA